MFVPLRKETSIGVCAVKLNLAFAAPSMLRSFFERVLTWLPQIFDKHSLWNLTSDSILRNDLNIGGWENTKHCVPFSLVPVAIHLKSIHL